VEQSTGVSIAAIRTTLAIVHFEGFSIDNLTLRNSSVFDFVVPSPVGDTPFKGSVTLERCFLPRSTRGLPTRTQGYRNMRAHLNDMQNAFAARHFHSAELGLERESERGVNWLFNWGYWLLADYGNSYTRPLVWIIILFLAGGLAVFFLGDAAPGLERERYVGAYAALLDCGIKPKAYRAAALSLTSGLNPASVLNARSLLVPGTGEVLAVLYAQRVLSAFCLALFIVSIRRRFKMGGQGPKPTAGRPGTPGWRTSPSQR